MQHYELEVFLTLEKTRSFTKTAELLHLSQPAISHRLKSLETSLGFTLFERRKGQKKIGLTAKGEAFISLAQRWHALWQEAHVLQHQELQASLSIGAVDSLNTTWLPSLYRCLVSHVPKIQLKVTTKTSLELYELVERQELDLAFVLREVNSGSVICEPIFKETMVVICHKSLGKGTTRLVPSDLLPQHEILVNWGPSFMVWHNRWWDPRASLHMEVDTVSLVAAQLAAPEHWAIVPKSFAHSHSLPPDFTMLEFTDSPPLRVCYKISHRYPQAKSRQALDLVNQHLPTLL
ncbi:MAG: LysR family transcriptional regulator [Negativicutes bacterium]|nr:LysR family transcriptional regulator [Negativicutes bacterium]